MIPVEVLPLQRFDDPEDGFGLQQAVLEKVGTGRREATMLVWTSAPYIAVTRLESRLDGFEEAVARAEALGFPTLVRNSGGGAVAANEGSLSFSLTFPVEEMRHELYERYTRGVELVAAALRRLGVRGAEGGEVEREFCPGSYSVRSGGERGIKHAGLAQRVTKRAARVEALILCKRTAELAEPLRAVYDALGKPFRPSCLGDLPVGVEGVCEALAEEVGERYGTREVALDRSTLERARELRGEWRALRA
ncbi:Lipoate-protein ligase A [Rubrobacter radiotolerans]|uniref:Lipoate--protein ligase family protein n=1 Tax=Rubrobacter radiotolerans TaxID=42256 RepID=A0A023X2D1_RUBRA|nr:lipoate--protein ligase family protein [Rubrobacter radiotolerans]AHY46150.1 Lipoate-protein ligase A [Rubrobacter radiotolerans]MDX5893560.1 lipoate--protein ligase family protein [Rubrobacter radiotolerans]SMC03984.1 Lipoate-protein ligase A [Rubrobacter radiotolerans DSM 5868]